MKNRVNITGKLLPIIASDADIELCASRYQRFISMRNAERADWYVTCGALLARDPGWSVRQQVELDTLFGETGLAGWKLIRT